MERWQSLVGLGVSLIICVGAAAFGAQFMPGTWYAQLQKPVWTPPNEIFAPVWTAIYLLMAVAAWLVWRQGGFSAAATSLVIFLLQLLLNAIWSWLFFGLQSPGWACVDIVFLWFTILTTLILFWRYLPIAGVLMLPYLIWVLFAAILNFSIYRLNS